MSDGAWRSVIVFVEGPSDRDALARLLGPLLQRCELRGSAVKFVPLEGKHRVMAVAAQHAVNILRNDPTAEVVVLPDLYPPNVGGTHSNAADLEALLAANFRAALEKKAGDERMALRFHVHCLKHDLEALILAVPDALAARLGVEEIAAEWSIPVEDQDHEDPPKRVVERLFAAHGQAYHAAIDAPLILERANHEDVVRACPQCFKPFVNLLESFCEASSLPADVQHPEFFPRRT